MCSTGNAEEHATQLSHALSQLAEVEEKIEQLHIQQVSDVIKLDLFMLNSKVRAALSLQVLSAIWRALLYWSGWDNLMFRLYFPFADQVFQFNGKATARN